MRSNYWSRFCISCFCKGISNNNVQETCKLGTCWRFGHWENFLSSKPENKIVIVSNVYCIFVFWLAACNGVWWDRWLIICSYLPQFRSPWFLRHLKIRIAWFETICLFRKVHSVVGLSAGFLGLTLCIFLRSNYVAFFYSFPKTAEVVHISLP